MTAVSILEPGNVAAISSEVVVPAGAVAVVGIYSATDDQVPVGVLFEISQATPGAPNIVGRLYQTTRSTALLGPGTFTVSRPEYKGVGFGVFADLG